jgi:hypothetical protein
MAPGYDESVVFWTRIKIESPMPFVVSYVDEVSTGVATKTYVIWFFGWTWETPFRPQVDFEDFFPGWTNR